MSDPSTDSRFSGIDAQLVQMRQDMSAIQDDVRILHTARAQDRQRTDDLLDAFSKVIEAFKAQRTALYTVGALIIVAALTIIALGHP